ncbi:MAG: hypothetical protein GWO07_13475 [Candidatus Dadabacteria bacterium]|nr:hypothetical protein [Candidatus Dadabacteria bacterium]NIS09737.1 hypothetical protein [Candidatus Dadabacteria bacterium]NIV41099.1 hypothetical protein [Candidatus Dadabacteria bacterium]NIX16195.1 hypothetical protein [Candidatus Dadabacteria bacterium]NIY22818.1 hypothetical protein [Candidatus Dadabacteria bacterium]
MRIAVLFMAFSLFLLNGAFAFETKCNFCSEQTSSYFKDNISEPMLYTDFLSSDSSMMIASEISVNEARPLTVTGENNPDSIKAVSYNLDNIIEFINMTEDIKSFTEDKIDLLANFRNGDDVVVPLGFFLYMNKKF